MKKTTESEKNIAKMRQRDVLQCQENTGSPMIEFMNQNIHQSTHASKNFKLP